mgnify:CR=1 FL=1
MDSLMKQEITGLHEQLQALEQWSSYAAQELQEVLDDAIEAGSDQPGIRALLDDHAQILRKMGLVEQAPEIPPALKRQAI